MSGNHLSKNKEHSSWQDWGFWQRKFVHSNSELRAAYGLPRVSERATERNGKCIASMLFLDCVLKQLGEEEIMQQYGQP